MDLAIVFCCRYGQGAGGDRAGGGGGREGGRREVDGSPGKRPQKSSGEPAGGRVGAGGVESPRELPREPREEGKGTPRKHQEEQ